MTREEARQAAEVMMAYADGREIEYYDDIHECWESGDYFCFNWYDTKYRVKPETKYRPFKNAEECWGEMLKHQLGWLKHKTSGDFIAIGGINIFNQIIVPHKKELVDMDLAFSLYVFADGTPFGVKED